MLIVKKEFSIYDFMELCDELIEDVGRDGLALVYDFLVDYTTDTGVMFNEMQLYDFLRFEVEFMSDEEVRKNYDLDEDDEVEEFLIDYTLLIGSYEEEGETFYIFTSF